MARLIFWLSRAHHLGCRGRNARLLAVEPDAGNFAVLQRNVGPYGDRATVLRGAVRDRGTLLQFEEATLGDGEEWGRQVKEGSGNVTAYDIPALSKLGSFDRISLLKMDVEGAEREIFSSNATSGFR